MAKQSRQFEHEDVAAVPRGFKVRTVTHPSGHRIRVAFPPGRRSTGSGTLVSILHPKGENPTRCPGRQRFSNPAWYRVNLASGHTFLTQASSLKDAWSQAKEEAKLDSTSVKKIELTNPVKTKTREQVERMQEKAVAFRRDVVKDNEKADEIEGLSLAEYAERKKITLANPKSAGRKQRKKSKARRRNADDAATLFKTFHGKTPKETLELHESAAMRGEFTSLGELIELVVKSVGKEDLRLGFDGEKVKLACAPTGQQLYLIGGNQTLNGSLKRFGADTTKDFVELGIAESIVYRASKDFTDFKSTDYEHEFGEESGDKPHVFYDKFKQRIFLMGGRYRVERPGIID